MKKLLLILTLLLTLLFSTEKKLILAEGNDWFPHMAKNLVANHDYISKLPFSGFVMVGNHYTDLVMQKDRNLTYEYVWSEVKEMKNLYPNRDNFLQVNIHFPADFWDDDAWEQITDNFTVVAKVAKELGFKGIAFDDEPYTKEAHKMVNFKFPTLKEVKENPNKFTSWEKKGAEPQWVDEDGYRNRLYNFKEHTAKVSERFKHIMQSMVTQYPNLTMLVYLGASLSHANSNKTYPVVIDMGLPREHEFHGAIFTGLKEGLNDKAKLYDMGESYKYRKTEHFGYAYQWRKYDIANNKFNNLDEKYQWVVPKEQRDTWSKDVNIGFMVSNLGQKSTYREFDTRKHSTIKDIELTLKKALNQSDKYVIYFSREQDWLYPNQKYPLKKGWREMIKRVYDSNTSRIVDGAM